MGDWYWIGVAAGIGVACAFLLAGLVGSLRRALPLVLVAAAGAGVAVGFAIDNWNEALAGGIGGALGALGAVPLVGGALRRGGTRAGTAVLVVLASVAIAGLAFVPVLGYLEAIAAPLLAARLRGGGGERYAGLRILARD